MRQGEKLLNILYKLAYGIDNFFLLLYAVKMQMRVAYLQMLALITDI